MKAQVQDRQSLFDISVQVYGSTEGVLALARDNDLSVTDELVSDQILISDERNIVDRRIVDYYATRGISPATDTSAEEIPDGGLEFIALEVDFMLG